MGIVSTRTCSFRLEPEGYVLATMLDRAEFELDDAKECVAATWRVAGERRRPVLVDSRGVRSQTRDAREYFMSEQVARMVTCVALLVGSPLSRMIGNFFIRIGEHRIPTRLFTDAEEARRWVIEHLR